MLEANYKVRSGRMTLKATAETVKGLFSEVAIMAEAFDADAACGKCGCPDIMPRVRVVGKFTYYELKCMNRDCNARLSLGQAQEGGTLFPKRKEDDDTWSPNHGWKVYRPEGAVPQAEPARATSGARVW